MKRLTCTASLSFLALLAVITTGCASTPTLGDRMANHGQATKELGSNWSKGESMVKKGMKYRKESESLAEKSRSRHDEAERLVAEGQQLQRQSEVAYQQQFGTVLASATSEAK